MPSLDIETSLTGLEHLTVNCTCLTGSTEDTCKTVGASKGMWLLTWPLASLGIHEVGVGLPHIEELSGLHRGTLVQHCTRLAAHLIAATTAASIVPVGVCSKEQMREEFVCGSGYGKALGLGRLLGCINTSYSGCCMGGLAAWSRVLPLLLLAHLSKSGRDTVRPVAAGMLLLMRPCTMQGLPLPPPLLLFANNCQGRRTCQGCIHILGVCEDAIRVGEATAAKLDHTKRIVCLSTRAHGVSRLQLWSTTIEPAAPNNGWDQLGWVQVPEEGAQPSRRRC
jgi:hypothetical protein